MLAPYAGLATSRLWKGLAHKPLVLCVRLGSQAIQAPVLASLAPLDKSPTFYMVLVPHAPCIVRRLTILRVWIYANAMLGITWDITQRLAGAWRRTKLESMVSFTEYTRSILIQMVYWCLPLQKSESRAEASSYHNNISGVLAFTLQGSHQACASSPM